MRGNMKLIDVAKLVQLVDSLKGNTAGPTNATQLERSLNLNINCIANAKRRGNMNADDMYRLEGYFNTELDAEQIPQPVTIAPLEPTPAVSEELRLLRENNRILKELEKLWLGGKDNGAY